MFKISKEKPPVWEELVLLFGVEWGKVSVTYGNTVHCPILMSADLQVHEAVHVKQQTERGLSPEEWWKRYVIDIEFRKSQELEAYREQFKFLKSVVSSRNILFKERDRLARDFSGHIYGKMLPYDEAFKLIGGK